MTKIGSVLSMLMKVRLLLVVIVVAVIAISFTYTGSMQERAKNDGSTGFWQQIPAAQLDASRQQFDVQPMRFKAFSLDRDAMQTRLAEAPREFTPAARAGTFILSLPSPNKGFQRFTVQESSVMEPELAAKHPDIKTYSGTGIDDPAASIRFDLTPLGFHASVRGPMGSWYIDPYYHLDQSVYVSYERRDLKNPHGDFVENEVDEASVAADHSLYRADHDVELNGMGFASNRMLTVTISDRQPKASSYQLQVKSDQNGIFNIKFPAVTGGLVGPFDVTVTDGKRKASTTYETVSGNTPSLVAATGDQLRTYRLALVTDPSYATYFGGSANVTAAKVSLINRVTQVYEYDLSMRLVLIGANDLLNLDTAAQATGTNGPCGAAACYSAAQTSSCTSSTLTRNRVVVGLLVGASAYDIGHIALGVNGGGVASLGVVGGNNKAQGCTGVPTPVGDLFAVDYVAHEMGHQFSGNHTFNGVTSNCSTSNRNAGTSVEPGSGSSIMGYAGICGADDTQPHSDPYFSQRSFDEMTTYTSSAETNLSDIQIGALTGFNADGQSFQLRYSGNDSAAIVRGTNYTTAGVKAAIEAISGWPAGGTVTVSALGDTAFTVTFGGTLAGVDAAQLSLVNATSGVTGYVSEITHGGPTTKNGAVSATGNSVPTVTAPIQFTIPIRTPFALTGSGADADNDTLTYLWEQNDRGATGTSAGTALQANGKANGPLFRQFGIAANVTPSGTIIYNSPGENAVTTNPTRVFPDLNQILADQTNALTGSCAASDIICFSEYLPTSSYVGTAGVNTGPTSLHMRLTVRDGRGGVNRSDTLLLIDSTAGPMRVTSQGSAVSYPAGSTQTVTWDVNGTDTALLAPNVKISLSTDGGNTYPTVLAASTANDGTESVVMPSVNTTQARLKVEAVGNVFFDVNHSNFTITGSLSATVSVSGRVTDSAGNGVGNAVITISDGLGSTRTTITSSFGYYRFDDVTRGGTFTVTASSKRYLFTPQLVTPNDAVDNLNFSPAT